MPRTPRAFAIASSRALRDLGGGRQKCNGGSLAAAPFFCSDPVAYFLVTTTVLVALFVAASIAVTTIVCEPEVAFLAFQL